MSATILEFPIKLLPCVQCGKPVRHPATVCNDCPVPPTPEGPLPPVQQAKAA